MCLSSIQYKTRQGYFGRAAVGHTAYTYAIRKKWTYFLANDNAQNSWYHKVHQTPNPWALGTRHGRNTGTNGVALRSRVYKDRYTQHLPMHSRNSNTLPRPERNLGHIAKIPTVLYVFRIGNVFSRVDDVDLHFGVKL